MGLIRKNRKTNKLSGECISSIQIYFCYFKSKFCIFAQQLYSKYILEHSVEKQDKNIEVSHRRIIRNKKIFCCKCFVRNTLLIIVMYDFKYNFNVIHT